MGERLTIAVIHMASERIVKAVRIEVYNHLRSRMAALAHVDITNSNHSLWRGGVRRLYGIGLRSRFGISSSA
jgi:hypothetical protein